jgi:hypothetical protein
MPTPADQRLLELLEKWLKSLELHIKYSSLDDDSYWKIQPWVKHQRPSRWIIDLARQKIIALQAQVQERVKQGDATFSESLELMTFLANLVGVEHIERFIPLAEAPDRGRSPEAAPASTPVGAPTSAPASATAPAPVVAPASAPAQAPAQAPAMAPAMAPAADASQTTLSEGNNATREMPKFVATQRDAPPPGSAQVARAERKPPPKLKAGASAKPADRHATKPADRDQVTADAVRLVQWGRKWYELAELIARMADRPPLPEVRRILEQNKSTIEKKARGE